MRYRSNLAAPDLRPYFNLLDTPMQHMGHDEPSDPDFLPNCGFWTDDEAAILYSVAKAVPNGTWADIGARLGWTAAHVAEAGHVVMLVDPEFRQPAFLGRIAKNVQKWNPKMSLFDAESSEYFKEGHLSDGFVIDGDHDSPHPLNDTRGALAHSKPDCIIMFHDVWGEPVRDGVRFLLGNGFRCRIYWTPNCVACCWRGYEGFSPPDHVPDPAIDWRTETRKWTDFDLSRCE